MAGQTISHVVRRPTAVPRLLAGLITAAPIAGVAGVAGAQYSYVRIDTPGSLTSVYAGTVNNKGEVAFTGFHAGNQSAVYKGSGGPLTTIASTGPQFTFFNAPTINCLGQVAVRGITSVNGIFRGSGGPVTTIYSASNGVDGAFIDDDGTCVFWDNSKGIMTGNGGPATLVAGPGGTFAWVGSPDISHGRVAFVGGDAAGGMGIYTSKAGVHSLVESADSQFVDVQLPRITSKGNVAWYSNTSSATQALRTSINGTISTFVDTSGPYSNLGFNMAMEINYYDQIAFSAILDSNPGIGIYTGPNPATDAVIQSGDTLAGKVVLDAYFGGLNDIGQISFGVMFDDYTFGMFRADPAHPNPDPGCGCPTPGSATCLLGAGWLFSRRRRA